jgi:hypothetical protein
VAEIRPAPEPWDEEVYCERELVVIVGSLRSQERDYRRGPSVLRSSQRREGGRHG